MAERIVNPRVRLMPNLVPVEDAAGGPAAPGEEESLASLAALSGVSLNNRSVSNFIATFSNEALARIQAATQ